MPVCGECGPDAGGVGLELGELRGAQAAQAGHRVGAAAALELVQARELALVQGDDDLAAALDGDAALLAVVVQARGALDAQARLQRAGLVVDAGVDDPGVVAGLARAHLAGRVDHGHAQPGTSREQLARAGQADDARPDDGEVVALHAGRVVVASGAAAVAWSVVQVLVTGASGAIGAELVPRLARGGHVVRAFARDPARVTAAGVERVVRGDAVTGAGLDEALDGIDVAYFLIHSMETALNGAGTFADRDRQAARRFADAARAAGVRRVVYLGGLVPADAPASPHLASRLEVEQALLDAAPEAVALRASIVVSARSRSFRFLVRLVERVPVMPLPAWRSHRTRPIDGRDVMAFLERAGDERRRGRPALARHRRARTR